MSRVKVLVVPSLIVSPTFKRLWLGPHRSSACGLFWAKSVKSGLYQMVVEPVFLMVMVMDLVSPAHMAEGMVWDTTSASSILGVVSVTSTVRFSNSPNVDPGFFFICH
jgi:hypothetical protein